MIDTHAHLTYSDLISDLEGVLERAKRSGIDRILVPGTDQQDNITTVELCSKYPHLYAGIGLHPSEANNWTPEMIAEMKSLMKADKPPIFVGDVGLDYFHEKDNKPQQERLFREMLAFAREYKLPLSIHCREAFEDVHAILREQSDLGKVVIHCFTGDLEMAQSWLAIGCWISFTATLTYKKNGHLRDVAKTIPLERIMLETDAPFLPPQDRRGEICEPADVMATATCLAEIRGLSVSEIDQYTSKTAVEFFQLS